MPELDERLKKLYVESRGDNPVIETKRKLPEDRRAVSYHPCRYSLASASSIAAYPKLGWQTQ